MRVYNDAKDLNIASKVFFGNEEDGKLYIDADFAVQVDEALLEDAFLKGVLVVSVDDVLYAPIIVDGENVTIAAVETNAFVVKTFAAAVIDG